jgi:quercetin dioxygenase-like cupin family protein
MTHSRYLDLAALRCLDLLDAEQASEFDRHVAQGCSACASELRSMYEVAGAIGFNVTFRDPPARLRSRLLERVRSGPQVWKQWGSSDVSDLLVVRKHDGEWQKVKEGVYSKPLFVDIDHDRVTMLIRMDPGASYVPHRHGGPEQCFVLEGDIREGDDVFHPGDFQCAAKDSVHGVQTTESGCLLLIVSSLRDKILASP